MPLAPVPNEEAKPGRLKTVCAAQRDLGQNAGSGGVVSGEVFRSRNHDPDSRPGGHSEASGGVHANGLPGIRIVTATQWRSGCALCGVELSSQTLPGGGADGIMVAYLDHEFIALLEADRPGVLLAPRKHVRGLSTLPELSGAFLAALRRTVTVVQSWQGASGATIEPTPPFPVPTSHACYRVVPTMGQDRCALSSVDLATRANQVAAVFGDELASQGICACRRGTG